MQKDMRMTLASQPTGSELGVFCALRSSFAASKKYCWFLDFTPNHLWTIPSKTTTARSIQKHWAEALE